MNIKQHGKKILGDSFVYGISGIITSFIGVFLIPLYTRVFQPADYGIIALLGSLQSIVTIFIVFGMDNSFAVWYWDKPTDEGRRQAVSNWFFFSLAMGLLSMILLGGGSFFIASFVLGDRNLYPVVILFAINIFLASTQKLLNLWFRMQRKPFHAVGFNLFVSLLTVGLNVWFVLIRRAGITGIYYSACISSLAALAITVVVLRKNISFNFYNRAELGKMIRFSLPLVPTGLIFWVMGAASPYFINFLMQDKAEIGLYQIGSTAAGLLGLGTFAFFQAFTAYALSIAKENNAKLIYARILEYYIYIGMTAALLLGLCAKFILHVFTNEKYIPAFIVIGILAFNIIVSGIVQVVSIANLLAKNNKPMARSAVIAVIITVACYFTLIPLFGKEGAALGVISGNLASAIYVAWKAQQLYPIPYNFVRIISFSLITAGIYIVYVLLG